MPFPPTPEETLIRSAILSNLRTYFAPVEAGDPEPTRFYEIPHDRIQVSSVIDTTLITHSEPVIWLRQLPTALSEEPTANGPDAPTEATLDVEIVGGVMGEGDDPYRNRERLAKDIERAIKVDSGLGCNADLAQPIEKEWGASEWDVANNQATEEICRVQVSISFDSKTSDA